MLGTALVMPGIGSDAMRLHLDAINTVIRPGAHAVLERNPAGCIGKEAGCGCRTISSCNRCLAIHPN